MRSNMMECHTIQDLRRSDRGRIEISPATPSMREGNYEKVPNTRPYA